ncbi:NADP-dependent oxidoreductase [Geofilum rubicundum]|uniref:Bifunctional protein: zinc-containing alcohol dehydrogenase n=1 Tax=Geofilum rubicundum JCM 15548 TaxID=1236989 RepID=A0A0E9LS86_9BACT|nr:NADP-dependent oxidoreductase [Geofilum rubicundum]GAO27725.1 bifunctional protein: zinc-containing alcohol dehydrogenase [Geofilum rubicundum JCM 15548]
MKALQITGYGDLKAHLAINEVEKPSVSEHQVLIEIYAASTNPIDYKIVEGALKQVIKLKFPAPIGFDVAGVVVAKGQSVTHLEIGDEIFSRVPSNAPGTFAEYIAIDSDVVIKKPANIDFAAAASIPLVGLTTVQCFDKARLKAGDKVLIHAGSGGVGTFAIQYAKAKGAYVYTTTSTKNVEWVKELGADRVIDYKTENYAAIAKDLDIVYDTLGGDYTLEAFKVIKKGGTVVSIAGDLDEFTAKDLGLNKLIRLLLALKRRKITRQAKAKTAHYYFVLMDPNASQLADIKTLIERQLIKPVIDKVYPLSNAVEALLHQKSGHAKGKIVIGMKA